MKKSKLLMVILCLVVVLSMFSACGIQKAPPLSDKYVESDVTAKAEKFVSLVNDGKAAETYDLMGDTLKKSITKEKLVEALNNGLDKIGKYESSTYSVFGNSSNDLEGDLATCVVVATHEKGKKQYTLTYNEKMELVGVYVK
ncbi:MAG: DUF3887 domain-containing protein [Clostridia bacterium]